MQVKRNFSNFVKTLSAFPATYRGSMLRDVIANDATLESKGFLSAAFKAVITGPKADILEFVVNTARGEKPAFMAVEDFERAVSANDGRITLEVFNAVEQARRTLENAGVTLNSVPPDMELTILHI